MESSDALHPNCERVSRALAERGLRVEVLTLPESTRSAMEAANAVKADISQIAKSLVFAAGNTPFLALVAGDVRASSAKLASIFDALIRQPRAEEVKMLTGFPIGGIPPIGHITPLPVVMDAGLLRHQVIWAAAGTPHAVFSCSPKDLANAVQARIFDIRED